MEWYESPGDRARKNAIGRRIQGQLTKVRIIRDTKRSLRINPALLVLIAAVGLLAAMYLVSFIGQLIAA